MEKFVIVWNAGFGDSAELIEAESLEEAENMAYEACMDEVNSNISYNAHIPTEELMDEYGLEDDL